MGIDALDDDLLSHVLHDAFRPLPWPWAADARLVSRRWRDLCAARQTRGWYLAHSTLGCTQGR